jgi:hypothetical protein
MQLAAGADAARRGPLAAAAQNVLGNRFERTGPYMP